MRLSEGGGRRTSSSRRPEPMLVPACEAVGATASKYTFVFQMRETTTVPTQPDTALEKTTRPIETYHNYRRGSTQMGAVVQPCHPKARTHAAAPCAAPSRSRAHRPRHELPRHPPRTAPNQICVQGAPQLRPAAPDETSPVLPNPRVPLFPFAQPPAAAAASEAVPLRRRRLPA